MLLNPDSSTTPWGPLGEFIFQRTYARTLGDGSLETWDQLTSRFLRGAQAAGAKFTSDEEARLAGYMHDLKGTGAGRMLWALGSQLQDALGSSAAVNCWVISLESPNDFHWMLSQLMTGGGVGYVVKPEHVAQWPEVRGGSVEHFDNYDAEKHPFAYVVADSREGWAEIVSNVIAHCVSGNGNTLGYTTHLVRKAGEPLKTFGGVASGPVPLIDGINDIAKVINARAGKYLRDVDLSDIANIIARLVVAGSKRRSAQLALGSYTSLDYIAAKNWGTGNIPGWRGNANFSVDCDDISKLPPEFWLPYYGTGTGENYGLLNIANARKYGRTGELRADPDIIGFNPCGEAQLPKYGSCNLATIHMPNVGDYDELRDVAKLLYRVQKAVATLPHPHARTQEIMNRDSRLGLSVTGYLQATEDQRCSLPELYDELRAYDREWSAANGLPESIRLTAQKPEGTVSLLSGVTSGIHAAYAQHYIRRVRLGADDPSLPALRAAGVPVVQDRNQDGTPKPEHFVAEFVIHTPPGVTLANEQTAIDQLEVARRVQRDWTDQAVSVTVTYRVSEVDAIRSWLGEHWHEMKSVSFNPYDEHGFVLPPYEPISAEEYERRKNEQEPIDFSTQEAAGMLDLDDCAGGACPIR